MKLKDLLKVMMIDDFIVFNERPEFRGTHLERVEIYDYRLKKGADRYEKLKDYLDYTVVAVSEDEFDDQIFISVEGMPIV